MNPSSAAAQPFLSTSPVRPAKPASQPLGPTTVSHPGQPGKNRHVRPCPPPTSIPPTSLSVPSTLPPTRSIHFYATNTATISAELQFRAFQQCSTSYWCDVLIPRYAPAGAAHSRRSVGTRAAGRRRAGRGDRAERRRRLAMLSREPHVEMTRDEYHHA